MLDQKKYPAYCRFCLDCVYYTKDDDNKDEYKCDRLGLTKLDGHVLNCNAD